MARVVLGESRLRARKRKRRLLFGGSIFFVSVFVVGGSVWLAHASFLRIITVAISGTATVPPGAIQSAVEQDIAGAYVWVYPKNNILLYPKSTIQSHLLTQFPTLKTADVHLENLHTVAVAVLERQPTALWCPATDSTGSPQAGSGQVVTSPACFLLDENGLAYAVAPDYSGDAYVKYSGTEAPDALPWQYLTLQTFHSLAALVDAVAKKGGDARVSEVLSDANSDVHVKFENGFELLFALDDDTGQIFERFSLALGAAPFTVHPLGDLEYLDLRFGDKLYYKLKGQ